MRDKDISIHALRGEGDIASITARSSAYRFQSTPSVGRATISKNMGLVERVKFQSTPSVGRATKAHNGTDKMLEHFNPRPPWGGRPLLDTDCQSLSRISIHALRGEGDDKLIAFEDKLAISIHALRGEGDFNAAPTYSDFGISIHALRGEGDDKLIAFEDKLAISIHALRGEGDCSFLFDCWERVKISIHALRGEGDHTFMAFRESPFLFQSTPSVGRATAVREELC